MTDDTAPALFGVDQVDRPIGPTERAVRRSLAELGLDTRDHGGAELAAQLAQLIDVCQTKNRDYAAVQAARELREQLIRLRADPVSRLGNDAGEIGSWLQQLGAE